MDWRETDPAACKCIGKIDTATFVEFGDAETLCTDAGYQMVSFDTLSSYDIGLQLAVVSILTEVQKCPVVFKCIGNLKQKKMS